MVEAKKTVREGAAITRGVGTAQGRMLRGALLGTTAIVGVTLARPAAAQTVTSNTADRTTWAQQVENAHQTVIAQTITGGTGTTFADGTVTTGSAGTYVSAASGFSNGNSNYNGTTANPIVTYNFNHPVYAFDTNYIGYDTAGAPTSILYSVNGGATATLITASTSFQAGINTGTAYAGVSGFTTGVNSVTFYGQSSGDALNGFNQIAYGLSNITSTNSVGDVNGRVVAPTFEGGTIHAAAGDGATQAIAAAIAVRANGAGYTGGTYNVDAGVTLTQSGGLANFVSQATGATDAGGAIAKTGTGTLVLGANDTYTGATTVSAGTLALSGAGAITSSTSVAVASGATFSIAASSGNRTVQTLSGAGSVVLGANTLTDNTTAGASFSGVISGSGGLTQSGTGTLILGGVNTYTGVTLLSGGSMILNNGTGNSIAASSGVTIAAGTLNVAGSSQTIQSLNGAGFVDLGAGNTLTLSNASGSYAGVIAQDSGAGALRLTGGTETLSGANTYAGGTTIGGATTLTATRNTAIGTGAVVDNGTLAFNGASGTVANGVSGSGGITVANVGAGNTLTFSGALGNGGGLALLDASTVAVNGSLVTSDVAIRPFAGATLNVGSGGVIRSTGNVTVQDVTGALAINNAGTIDGTSGNTISTGQATLTLVNTGTVSTSNFTAVLAGANSSVTNSGTITGGTDGTYGIAVEIASGGAVTNQANGSIVGRGAAGVQLNNGGTVTNSAGSSLIQGSRGIYSGGALTLTNYGTVTGTDATLAAVDTTGAASAITNYGTLQGGTQGIVLNNGGAVYNYGAGGVIKGTSNNNLDDASGIYANGALTLNNQGAISTASTGTSYGVQVLGAATLSNSGSIVATDGASGVRVDGGGSIVNTGTITGAAGGIKTNGAGTNLNLVNTGTITSRGVTMSDNDDALFATGSATVLNAGTMTAALYAGVIAANGGATVTNAASGVLTGGNQGAVGVAVNLASAGTFTNYGQASSTGGHGVYS